MVSHLAHHNPASLQVYVKEEQSWYYPWEWSLAEHHGRELLGQHAARIRELCVVIPFTWVDVDPPCLSLPLKSIEKLVLKGDIPDSISSAGWKGMYPLFGGGPMPIRALSLAHVPFLPANRICQLTHLRIVWGMGITAAVVDAWSLRSFLIFLSGTPLLQEAFIHGIPTDSASHAESERLPDVQLKHLRRISLRAWDYSDGSLRSGDIAASLLSHLTFPDTCYIRVDASKPHHLLFLSSYLCTGLRWTDSPPRLKMLCICDQYVWSIQVTSHSTTGEPCGGLRIDMLGPRSLHDDVGSDQEFLEAVRVFMQSPSLFSGTQVAWISGWDIPYGLQAGLFDPLFSYPTIRELYGHYIGRSTPEGFIESLGSASPNSTTLPLPQLDTLFLTIYDQFDLDALNATLRCRAEARCPIRRLMVNFDFEDDIPFQGSLQDPERTMRSAIEPYVEELLFLTEEEYNEQYSRSKALAGAICVEHDENLGRLWPPWTERAVAYLGLGEG